MTVGWSPATGSYSANKDCTGSFSLVFPPQDGPRVTVNFVVTADGFEIDTVVVGVCSLPDNPTPPCAGQGANSIRSTLKRRFLAPGS